MDTRKKVISVFALLVVSFCGYFGYRHYRYVETDDAQVQAHFLMLSSRVNGTIQKVLVNDHQRVKKGDVLAQIDTSDYSTQSDAAESQVASLEARYKEAEVNFKRAAELLRQIADFRTAQQNVEGSIQAAALAAEQVLGHRLLRRG